MISRIHRKKLYIGLVLLSLSVVLSANEVTAVWSRLYQRASSLDHKIQMMMNIVEQHDRDMVPVLSDALDEQVRSLRNIESVTERSKAYTLTKMIVKELGRLKALEAAGFTWEVVEAVDDPLLKGEALIALGRMGAKRYAEQMATMLRNLNFNYDDIQKQRDNEIVAYALILSLERLKDPVAYEPIFFASIGWYSSRSGVKERAKEALAVIVDNPIPQLKEIMENSDRFSVKQTALEAGIASQAPEDSKAELAVLAIEEGLQYTAKDGIERRELRGLRISALDALRRVETKDPAAIEPMKRMLIGYQTERRFQEDEMLYLLSAMSTFRDDETARALSDFLNYQTDRRSVRASDSLRIAKATIQALGSNGSSVGFEALTLVSISGFWEGSVQREAKAALKKLD